MNNSVNCWSSLLGRTDVLIFDCETTGLNSSAECVEIGIINTIGDIMGHYYLLPSERYVPQEASDIHGLTIDKLVMMRAIEYKKIHNQLLQLFFTSTAILSYNSSFDLRLLMQTANKYKLKIPRDKEWHCIMLDYANHRNEYHPYFRAPRWHKLQDASKYEGIDIKQTHSAVDDCHLTLKLMQKLSAEHN